MRLVTLGNPRERWLNNNLLDEQILLLQLAQITFVKRLLLLCGCAQACIEVKLELNCTNAVQTSCQHSCLIIATGTHL